jgi:hypothetical protein
MHQEAAHTSFVRAAFFAESQGGLRVQCHMCCVSVCKAACSGVEQSGQSVE